MSEQRWNQLLVVTRHVILNDRPLENESLPWRRWRIDLLAILKDPAQGPSNDGIPLQTAPLDPTLPGVRKLRYVLHSTFNKPPQDLKEAPYFIEEEGWGGFFIPFTLFIDPEFIVTPGKSLSTTSTATNTDEEDLVKKKSFKFTFQHDLHFNNFAYEAIVQLPFEICVPASKSILSHAPVDARTAELVRMSWRISCMTLEGKQALVKKLMEEDLLRKRESYLGLNLQPSPASGEFQLDLRELDDELWNRALRLVEEDELTSMAK